MQGPTTPILQIALKPGAGFAYLSTKWPALPAAPDQLLYQGMKTTNKIIIGLGAASLAALPLMSAPPVVTVHIPPPAITVQVPVPAVPAPIVAVPDNYVWDGYEYVGVVGSQYYYLVRGNAWLALDPTRLARFHGWEKDHSDWRAHAIHNERYRHDAAGHETPLRDNHGHDKDRDH